MQSGIDREVSIETFDYVQDQVGEDGSGVHTIQPWTLCSFAYRRPLNLRITPWDTPSIMPRLVYDDHMVFRPHDGKALTRYSPRATCSRDVARRRGRYIAAVGQRIDTASLAVNAHQSRTIAIVAERLQTVKLD
jgi:hypothetical protein